METLPLSTVSKPSNTAGPEVDESATVSEGITRKTPWWHRRTQLERILILMFYFTVLTFIIIFTMFIYFNANKYSDLCLTEECMATAQYLLKGMNLSVDPCEDFYRFTCGKAEKRYIPDDATSVDMSTDIDELVLDDASAMLIEPIQDKDGKPLKLAKTYYGLCLDKHKTDESSLRVLDELMDAMGGWPVIKGPLPHWSGAYWSWINTTYKFREAGFRIDSIFELTVHADPINSRYILAIGGPELASRLLSLKQDGDLYFEYAVKMVELLGAGTRLAEIEMDQVLDFAEQLDLESAEPLDLENFVTIEYLIQHYPTVPWLEYINKMLLLPTTVDEKEPILLSVPKYIDRLDHIMKKTSKRVVANYMWWKQFENIIPYLPDEFRDLQSIYLGLMTGASGTSSKEAFCMKEGESLAEAVNSEYIKRYVTKDLKERATRLVHRVKAELSSTLLTVSWMDESTRKNALDKCDAMRSVVAYPDQLVDEQEMEKFYKELEISSNITHLEAKLKINRFITSFEFKKLRENYVDLDWPFFTKVLNTNAFYRADNLMIINLALLQHYFYSYTQPNYLNYGGIGWVVGHEITHGFDDKGSRYDKRGVITDWWDKDTREEFENRINCLIDQYSGFVVASLNESIDGNLTLAENIADNGGVKFAYKAYQKWARVNNVEPRLPGFQNYNSNQMFWILAAATWCTAYRPERLSYNLHSDEHAPAEFRVIGSFQNSKEFARDFNCPIGSPMNPIEKCLVW